MKTDAGITGLADAIEALRIELLDAVNRAQTATMHFKLGPIEMNVEAVVTTGLDGRIGWGVLGVGGKREAETTHRLRFTLQPFWPFENSTDEFVIGDKVDAETEVRGGAAGG